MTQNLFRNPGFETGDDSFWELTHAGVMTIQSGTKKYGDYAAQVALDSMDKGYLYTKDYIPVDYGSLYIMSSWVYAVAGSYIYWRVSSYTDGLDVIESPSMTLVAAIAGWNLLQARYVPKAEVAYIKPAVVLYAVPGAGDYFVDTLVLKKAVMSEIVVIEDEIADVRNATGSGDTKEDSKYLYGAKEYFATLKVTALTGTNPTMDLDVCELDVYENERVLGTFAQLTGGASDERITLTKPSGQGIYLKYTAGGTVTDFDCYATVTGVV